VAGWCADLVAGLRSCWMDGWWIGASKVVGWRAGLGGYFAGMLGDCLPAGCVLSTVSADLLGSCFGWLV
jgi:hypothetical protein